MFASLQSHDHNRLQKYANIITVYLEFNELNKINGVVASGLSEAVGLTRDPHEDQ